MSGDNNNKSVLDVRKVFVVSLIGSYYSKQLEELEDLFENEELISFLDDPTATLLTARLTPQSQGQKVVLDNKANLEEDDESVLVFYKRGNETITPENIHRNVGTVTMIDSPNSTLHLLLKKTFIPGLVKNNKTNKNTDHKIQDPMMKLEKALNEDIQSKQSTSVGKPKGITNMAEEKAVWSTAPTYARNANEKEIAAWIFNLVDTIDKELKSVSDWSSGTQIFGTILNCLDDIWKMGEKYYPESRMIHLLDIVGHEIVLIVQTALKSLNLWDTPFNDLEKDLIWGMTMCEKYIDVCHNLTGMLWPSDASRQFHRGEYTPSLTAAYSDRLKEILRIRSVHKQLVSLVTLAESDILHPRKCFAPFIGINPIFYNVYTEPLWKHAVEKFEKLIVPAETSISNRLLAKLNVEANAFQLLAEYKRYKELIMRPKVAQAVMANREQLLVKLLGVAEKIKAEFTEKKMSEATLSSNVSPTVANIYYARKASYRVKDIEDVAEAVLKDLSGYEELTSQLTPIKQDIDAFESQVYNTWLGQVTEAISNNELTLKKSDAVIEFSDGRLMEVTYNPKLVNLIDEAQQLATMGFRITREIQDAVVEAKKFLRQAKELDQIASFHNTIGDRMIPSQRPMMLEAAVALSKLVQSQYGITWDEADQVETYTSSLKNLVTILAKQNNVLSQYHIQVKEKVKSLFDTDLVRQQQKWKNIMQEIRSIFTQVQDQGFKNMKSWESHWDRQLYKVLEVKYLQGMVKVHEALPEIHIELVYRQQKLQFKPPLEEARMKYYTNLKRFLMIPKQFRGVTDENPDDLIFGIIVQRNCHRFEKLYRDAELCISKVAATKARYEDWVALGSADIDALSKECLVSWEDWDRNFKTSKAKGQEVSRLPTADERVGCFVISYAVLRFEIELLNRKYWEVLVTLLQNSIIQEMATAETFLNDATDKLRIQPSTVEEIAIANALEEQLAAKVPEIRLSLESVDKKNKTLATWTKDRTDLSRIKGLWENFLSLFENHQFLIGRQVETIKGNLEQQMKAVNEEAQIFKIRWDELKPKEGELESGTVKLDDVIAFIHEKRDEWDLIVQRRAKLMESCTNIGLEDTEFPMAEEIEEDIRKVESTWIQLEEFKVGLKDYEEEDWIVFRTRPQRLEEFLVKWDGEFRNQPKTNVIIKILKDLESYKSFLPNLKYIRGDSFTEKHWYELFNILRMPSKPLGLLKLGDFLQSRHHLEDHLKEIQELNARAAGEITVRQALNELDAWEIEAKFDLAEHTDAHKNTVHVIQDFKALQNKIGDNQSLLQSIRTSPFYSHFADRISVWETRLADLDEYIENLSKVQRRWIYLEPIFSQGVLESEQQRFRRINEEYRGIMDSIGVDSRVVGLCKIQGIRNRLNMLVDQLSRCQNSLNEFLETKRSGFPRFYFLGDDDLLEILGQSTKPNVIQAHLKKLFAGIFNVEFDSDHQHIIAMKSVEEEVVPLKSKVKISSNVEEWLSELANEMKYTLKSNLLDCIAESKKAETSSGDPLKYPAQILTLCNSIQFCDHAEEAIRSSSLESLHKKLQSELDTYTNVTIPDNVRNPKVMELKYKDLILDTIHNMSMIEFLLNEHVKNVNEWSWQKQLRFYLRDDGSAVVKMADAEFVYSYEYQGNEPKLVHTPLTDKCYLTLTQGMRMGLGGNPYGPAGTGKTESVKALGSLLGRQVLVFNCDEGIDVKAMGRIFVGLVKCGAWGCFDEVNRLEGATLSAVSMQIQPIQIALKTGAPTVQLMEETVTLDSNAGIFVTLNPAGKGYGGRNKLPDNLKQLFRPVVMSQPDNDLIAEVILYTEGFKNAKKIGRKLVEIFKLSSKLLTPQTHYDWGLRALKTVLKGCGSALKEYKAKNSQVSEEDESDIVVATLRLNTLPKLTYSDCFRFDHLIKDVFPSVNFKDLGHHDLAESVRAACEEMNLTVNENQVKKCLELYEQLQQRMGVVIVGPSCCGKSTILSLLKNALLRMGMKIKSHFINPKSISRTQLLGQINLDTRQWTDGVLTLKAQQVYAEPPDITSWIVCDGDIDPEWIESLNSVLDDNRLLTLPSGWRIKFGSNVNFIFETHDLSYASPATISRMGMIFMSEEDADIKGIISTWLKEEVEESERGNISQLIDDYFYKAIAWIQPQFDVIVALPLVSIVRNALSQLVGVKSVPQMAVAMIRGFSGHLSRNASLELASQVLSWTGLSVPREWNLLNLYYNVRTMSLEVFQDESLDFSENYSLEEPPLVQTTDVKQTMDLVKPWLENHESFLLIGPEGCGKSMILEYAFSQLRSTEVAIIHCSGLVSPQHVLQKLTQYCITISTNSGRVYKSKDGERLILYFKDLNLVKPDKWGTCQLVEFLQQLISYKGFYDGNLEWVGIEGLQIVASINTGVSSAKYALSPRFTSIVRVGSMGDLLRPQLDTICRSYMQVFLKLRYPSHRIHSSPDKIQKIAKTTIQFYESMKTMFKASNQNHYQFTPRDLTKWILGLMRYELQDEDPEGAEVIEAWTYETCRMFRDKLVSSKEKENFDKALTVLVAEEWGLPDMIEKLESKACYFVSDLTRQTNTEDSKGKQSSPSLGRVNEEEMGALVEKGVSIFGREYRTLNIVLFTEVIQNVANFDRALSARHGCMVLAGRCGVGRRTAVSIVSALHGATPFTLKVGRNYGIRQFKIDLKTAIQMSAVEGNKVYFIIEDFQLVDVIFLDMLNSLLSSGEVPGLYSPEELDGIISPLREAASLEGHTSSLYAYFAGRVRELLRIILIMDFTNENFLRNCESNPAIYKQCFFSWMDVWSTESLSIIPALIIDKYYQTKAEVESTAMKEAKKAANEVFMKGFLRIYESLEANMTSPRRYFALIHNYASLFTHRIRHISEQMSRLAAGVSKLADAKQIVETLKKDAAEQEIVLAKKQSEANKALELITETMRNANIQRGEVQTLREKTEKENESLEIKKKAIDEELAGIEPEVKKAQASVGSIKNEAISEIRSLRAPPEVIRDILEAVLRLMGIMDMSWNSMKLFLSQRGVKEEIRNFDARKIGKKDRDSVEKLLREKPDSFTEHAAKRASAAAAPLASWVLANVKYSRALEKIEPLERQQLMLKQGLIAAEDQLGQLSSELLDVDKRVEKLKGNLNRFTKEAAEVEIRLGKAKDTLVAAEGLVGKLEDEFTRWSKRLEEYGEELKRLPVKTLLAAGFITYLSEASEEVRERFIKIWSKSLKSSGFNLLDFLSTEKTLRTWQGLGLPSDRLSLENGLIINETTLRPFLVDPTSRGAEWLKATMEATRPVVAISLHDAKFPHELELAVRFGKVLIVTEADAIEPILIPILRGDITCQGTREMVQIGDKSVDMSPTFRVFMVTRNPSPKIPPDAASVITVVNFTTTKAGLTSQLMTNILEIEKPELREKNTELIKNVEEMKMKLSEMGDQLLLELANAQGNILENQDLLNSLNRTKENSTQIEASLAEQSVLEASLNQEINVYLPLAEFGSLNYFALLDLAKLNKAYQFSLSSFINLFVRTLKAPNKTSTTEARITSLQQELENAVFDYVCRCLFKEYRVAFAMSMAHAMHPKLFRENEWEAFTGQLVTDMNAESLQSFRAMMPGWINDDRIIAVLVLKTSFPELYDRLGFSNEGLWSEFYSSNECEEHLPPPVKESCSAFQILMVIQTLRPDRLHTAMTNFARHALGRRFLFPPPMNLSQVFVDTIAEEPILLIVQSGADPSQELRELAQSSVGTENFVEISMGQGQAEMIIGKMNEAAQKGQWICLKNLHLVTHWLDSLEKEIQKLKPNQKFRLWLTSEPHHEFPTVLAQTCLKIAYEAPQGLKKNLQQTYGNWSEEYVSGDRNVLRIQSLLVLAIFHAVVQERRTFIPQGWSKFYEFNESDIRAGADVLDQMFKGPRSKEIQWQYVRGLFENAIYGGRVDNVYDVRVLVSYLDEYFNDMVLTGTTPSRKTLCNGVRVPSSTKAQDYLDVINSMPEFDKPAAFGLPGNIERSWQRVVSSQVINQLKTLSRIFTDSARYDRSIWYRELTPILNLWKKLVQGSSVASILQSKSSQTFQLDLNNADPIEAFVKLEYFTVMKLLKFIHSHLGAISKTVRGATTPSAMVFDVGDSLLKRQTPEEWLKKWEGPPDPTVYLQGLVRRALSIMEWEKRVKSIFDSPLDLSDLLNPDTFLGAFKQQCARKLGVSMDELVFVCMWESGKSSLNRGINCKLTGLLLEGCSFDGLKLTENSSESLPIIKIPDCSITWVSHEDANRVKSGYTISVPLYYNETRDRIIGSLDLPSSGDHAKWIQAGVAAFLKT